MGSAVRTALSKVLGDRSREEFRREIETNLRAEANACAADGDMAGACACLHRLLEWETRQYGDSDLRTLTTRIHLADQLQARGMFDHAQAHYSEALRLYRDLGPSHERDVLVLEFTRAQAFLKSGDLAAGRELLQHLHARSLTLFGPEHPATLAYSDSLASAILRMGDLEAAKPLVLAILKARTSASSGPDCSSSLATASVLVTQLLDRSNWQEALPIQEQIVRLLIDLRGPADLDTLRGGWLFSLILVQTGQLERARTHLQSIATPFSQTLGRTHPETLNVFSLLATVMCRLDDLLSARALLERCYSLCDDAATRGRFGGELAAVLLKLRDFEALNQFLRELTAAVELDTRTQSKNTVH